MAIILVFPDSVALPSDANVGGAVNIYDLVALANNYGGAGDWNDGDFTGNGLVDVYDLALLANDFESIAGGSPIPEPATLALLAGGLFSLARRRRMVPSGF